MDPSSFFHNSHDFGVGRMDIRNHSGAHNDHSRTNVKNIYRGGGGNTSYRHYDHSVHDSGTYNYGNTYNTTNYQPGPTTTNNHNYNAPTYRHNYNGATHHYNGPVNHYNGPTNTYRGPVSQYHAPVHHHNAPRQATYNYTTHARDSTVVNGDFRGEQYNGNPEDSGFCPERSDSPSPIRSQTNSPMPRPAGRRSSSVQNPFPSGNLRHSQPVPVPGWLAESEPDVPERDYCTPTFNPWAKESGAQRSSAPRSGSSGGNTEPGTASNPSQPAVSDSDSDHFVEDSDTDSETEAYRSGLRGRAPKFRGNGNSAAEKRPLSIPKGDWRENNPLLTGVVFSQ
ncbi:hypothetical protein FA13DRAFT_1794202 [Coprinellus micaceus]|uniref:Uncharacterized protein n=1 Tax=Coprinellus micaceus TaxID=71717 RepID=A0A4Y7T2K7_COPMI|nr:hypothetical protein FA13DRAFT_1794202 [Coprinellus micaceus]